MTGTSLPESGASIGEIIAAALTADIDAYCEEQRLLARIACARHLAHRLAPLMGVPEGDAWDALTFIPDNQLYLLDSPEGWTTLADTIARDLGVYAPSYAPGIH